MDLVSILAVVVGVGLGFLHFRWAVRESDISLSELWESDPTVAETPSHDPRPGRACDFCDISSVETTVYEFDDHELCHDCCVSFVSAVNSEITTEIEADVDDF